MQAHRALSTSAPFPTISALACATLLSLLLVACGGGGGSDSGNGETNIAEPVASFVPTDPSAPQATGNTATDGINWFSFRRQQVGVQAFVVSSTINSAALRHSEYQQRNRVVSHQETPGLPGFTGIEPGDRLLAAGYQFGTSYAYGEVISNTSDDSGFAAAEDLIGAVYHRFVIFEPTFREAGAGAVTSSESGTYLTAKFAANGTISGLGAGQVVIYPFSNQEKVPVNFFSDNEIPDPVTDRDEVGYPISVHADITANVLVQSFTVRPRNGTTAGEPLSVRLLTRSTDASTPPSAVAIVPLAPLQAATTYEVAFNGSVDGFPVQRNWTFTTR